MTFTSLLDQRTDDPVFLVKFLSGHADTGAGLLKAFPIFAVSKPGIVSVFVSNGAMGNLFIIAIADMMRTGHLDSWCIVGITS